MSGDIILSNGSTITADELASISSEVKKLIAKEAKDPAQYEEVGSLANLTTLPALLQNGSAYKLVRVAVELLKGVDGKEVSLRKTDTALQWQLGDGEWQDLLLLADIKGEKGDPFTYDDFTDEQIADLKRPATEAAETANQAAEAANQSKEAADQAEAARIVNESNREASETERQTNELQRQSDTATAIGNAEAATTSANEAAAKANNAAIAANTAAENITRKEVPTLESAPTEETVSYVNSKGDTIQFYIGDECRVMENGEYTFYKLYDLVDGVASWDEIGSGLSLTRNLYLQSANYYNESVQIVREGDTL